jgi:hypothetical protein
MAFEKHLIGYFLFLDAAIPGVLEKEESEQPLRNTTILEKCFGLPLRNTLWLMLCLSAAYRGISVIVDGSIRCNTKNECPGKAYLTEAVRG